MIGPGAFPNSYLFIYFLVIGNALIENSPCQTFLERTIKSWISIIFLGVFTVSRVKMETPSKILVTENQEREDECEHWVFCV